VRLLLLLLALIVFLLAAGTWFGILVDVGDRHAHGCVALGLALYVLQLSPALPRPPAPRRES
jgi:predicted anti-sigma-YlaC factor YlaD